MNDRFIDTVISRAGVVRVRNALNALLWLCAICVPSSLLGLYLFRDDPELKYVFMGLLVGPVITTVMSHFWFLFRDPNRLQSEEFVLRQQELSIERKALPPTSIERNEAEDILVIDAVSQNREKGEAS